jgi:hypothetical protein
MGHRAAGTTSIYTHLFREAYEDVERVLDHVYNSVLTGRARPLPPRKRKERSLTPGHVPQPSRRF